MFASLATVLNLLLVTAEMALSLDGGPASTPLLALALAAAAVLTVAIAFFLFRLAGAPPSTRATRSIDPSAPLAQSDPDAPGRPRPRAPGYVASAA